MVDCMLKNGIKMNSWECSHPSPLRAVPAAFPGCSGTQCALLVRGEEKSEKARPDHFPQGRASRVFVVSGALLVKG